LVPQRTAYVTTGWKERPFLCDVHKQKDDLLYLYTRPMKGEQIDE
jgi:hypothetical protein